MTAVQPNLAQHQPQLSVVRRIVELATRAPSVDNTQPWIWRTDGPRLLLHADRSRRLRAEDPVGRNLTISCGAALHHARAAAGALGWETSTILVPEGPSSTLLASLSFTWVGEPSNAAETIASIEARRTDRRRFTAWPVPDERLRSLAETAGEWGARAAPITGVTERFQLERLVQRALDLQQRDERLQAEPGRQHRPSRFPVGLLDDAGHELEGSDGLLVMYDVEDDLTAWLRAGQGLGALWLRATRGGLSVVPLSQVVEVAETREAVQHQLLGGLAVPLILVRVGWQAISRSDLPPTPRRPLDEVLDPG